MTEFWAAIIGAVVGALAAGGVTALLQQWQYGREKRDRDRAYAQSLFFKVLRIHSDLEGFNRHILEANRAAERDGVRAGWQTLKPIGNLPSKVSFSGEEMAFLLSLKDMPLFNRILSLDAIHGSTVDVFALYASRRQNLLEALPATMDGGKGSVDLSALKDDLRNRILGYEVEVRDLDQAIRQRAASDAENAWKAMNDLNQAMRPILGYELELEAVEATEEKPINIKMNLDHVASSLTAPIAEEVPRP